MHRTLDEVTPEDAAHIGGKAYNCARLRHAGFPVPDGLAIPSGASDSEIRSVVEAPWLAAQPGEALFAVRSSGLGEDSEGHSFAGIHETYLNVARDGLVDAVFRCRASGASQQAAAYRAARQLEGAGESGGNSATAHTSARIGVLVQRMVPAVASGVAFTVNPVSGADELVINAAPGLGEALVSGQVDPDEFIVGKRDGLVVSRRLGSAGLITTAPAISTPTLTAKQIADLAALLLRIEQHYGAPQDVEWCHDGRQFWIVQSRPVTAIHSGRSQAGPEVSSHSGPRASNARAA